MNDQLSDHYRRRIIQTATAMAECKDCNIGLRGDLQVTTRRPRRVLEVEFSLQPCEVHGFALMKDVWK